MIWRHSRLPNPSDPRTPRDVDGKGDVPAILDLVTDDVTWTCPGPTEILPYAQVYKGKEGVAEFFRLIYANKDFPGFEVKELIEEGNVRKITIKDKTGKEIAQFPLTVGVVGALLS